MITLYTYIDYRKYLSNVLENKRAEDKKFSHRYVLKRMGITFSGYLSNVISGKNCFSIKDAVSLGRILDLSSAEIEYLKKLIYFSKAKTVEEKNIYFKQIMDFRKRRVSFLKKDQLSLYSEWYTVVIREILHTFNFTGNYAALARMVRPKISASEAKKSIQSLEKMGLVEKNSDGVYKPVNRAITTGDQISSFHVKNFHRKMVNLAEFAIEKTPSAERDISALTLSISEERFDIIRDEIQEFRKKILQIAEEETNPEQVFQCNFHLFPVSNKSEEKE